MVIKQPRRTPDPNSVDAMQAEMDEDIEEEQIDEIIETDPDEGDEHPIDEQFPEDDDEGYIQFEAQDSRYFQTMAKTGGFTHHRNTSGNLMAKTEHKSPREELTPGSHQFGKFRPTSSAKQRPSDT